MTSISKRQFLESVAGGLCATSMLSLATFEHLFAQTAAIAPGELAQDNDTLLMVSPQGVFETCGLIYAALDGERSS